VRCFFVSDLHGKPHRYARLFDRIDAERPSAVLLGGDLLPMAFDRSWALDLGRADFVNDVLGAGFRRLRETLGDDYPRVLLILGNDDPRIEEAAFLQVAATGLWDYIHDRRIRLGDVTAYGYAYVPPTPFQLKDWERYDVSRYVDPGCIAPDEGQHTVPVTANEMRYTTIRKDLERLAGDDDLARAIFLFHSPPYHSKLDRAALDGQMVDHAPIDVHVGSIAIQRFIAERQPMLTLHGHIHESARITGSWRDRSGRTHMFSAAHDGPELALIRFDTDDLDAAGRELL
jgi:Icc-related predicted phosphoesterase